MQLKHRLYTLAGIATVALTTASIASASATYPLSGVATSFTGELTNAVTTALPIAGPIVALFVGWRVFKRISHG